MALVETKMCPRRKENDGWWEVRFEEIVQAGGAHAQTIANNIDLTLRWGVVGSSLVVARWVVRPGYGLKGPRFDPHMGLLLIWAGVGIR